MSFKRIGDIAWRLARDPAKLQAAANEAPRMKGGSEPSTRGEGRPDPLPIAQASGRTEASNLNRVPRKEADAVEAPASASRGNVKQGETRSVSLPDMSRSMATVYSTEPHRESLSSAVVIDLSMWKEAHARSETLRGAAF